MLSFHIFESNGPRMPVRRRCMRGPMIQFPAKGEVAFFASAYQLLLTRISLCTLYQSPGRN